MVDVVHRILADTALSFSFRPEQLDVIEAVLLQHLRGGCAPVAREHHAPNADGIVRIGNPEPVSGNVFNLYTSAYCPRGGPGSAGGWAVVFENGASLSGGLLADADAVSLNIIAATAALSAILESWKGPESGVPIVIVRSDHRQFVSLTAQESGRNRSDARLWADLEMMAGRCDAHFAQVNMHALSASGMAGNAWALAHDAGRLFLKRARLAA